MRTRLRIIQHNVLTWDSRKYDLANTYRQLDPDIILINGHGLRDDARLKIPGYKIYQRNTNNEPMDGVAIAVRRNIRHRIEEDFLSETLAINTDTADGPLIIATSYLPPRRPFVPHPDFLRLLRRQSPVFIAGDLNARHPTLGYTTTNQVGRDLITYLRHQTARHIGPFFPTYYGPQSSTSPDIVLTNPNNHFHYSITPGPLTTSDHIPIILDISSSPILIPSSTTLAYHRTNWDAFQNDEILQMNDLPVNSHATLEEIDDALEDWVTSVKEAMDRHVPKTKYRQIPSPSPSRTTQITKIQFQALRDRATRTGWTYHDYRRYIQLRLTLQDSRREEANRYWGQTLTELAAKYKDPAVFWCKLRRLSGSNTLTDTYLSDQNGQRHYTDIGKETIHTSIWENVFQAEEDGDVDNDEVLDFLRVNLERTTPYGSADPARLTGASTMDCRISTQELVRAIRKSKNTCPGSSGINKTILSHLPECALGRLRAIFDAALSAGYFPDLFKEAEMRMVAKPGKVPTRPDSYRPISLLEVPGKLLERVVVGRLRDHIDGGNLYSPAQYGFRQGRGTSHAIAIATETLAIYQASGYRCNLILRDVSKAFDKVWHIGLKYKLLHLGLPGPIERFLCDFLEDRTARVRVGRHVGPPFPIACGVPQGSVLSPTLYTIYTNDCPSSAAGINVQYADDVSQVIFHPGRSGRMLSARTEREITRVSAYEREWRIKTNLNKFTVIPTATRNPSPLFVGGDPVDYQRHGSLLGLRTTAGGYTTHVTMRVGQARAALAKLYRFRDMETKIKLHLIKALVIPVLTYPPVPIHALSKKSISRLQKVQNAALRFAYNIRWDSFMTMEELHERASIPALNIRLHTLAAQVWRRIEDEGGQQFLYVQDLHREAPHRSHAWFPRSLMALESNQNQTPRYT